MRNDLEDGCDIFCHIARSLNKVSGCHLTRNDRRAFAE